MLVLSRKLGEKITIGEGVTVSIVKVQGNRVQLGIQAPPDVRIHREEIQNRVKGSAARPCPSTEWVG